MRLLLAILFFVVLGCTFIYACVGVIAANPNLFEWNIWLRGFFVLSCVFWVVTCFKSGGETIQGDKE